MSGKRENLRNFISREIIRVKDYSSVIVIFTPFRLPAKSSCCFGFAETNAAAEAAVLLLLLSFLAAVCEKNVVLVEGFRGGDFLSHLPLA